MISCIVVVDDKDLRVGRTGRFLSIETKQRVGKGHNKDLTNFIFRYKRMIRNGSFRLTEALYIVWSGQFPVRLQVQYMSKIVNASRKI